MKFILRNYTHQRSRSIKGSETSRWIGDASCFRESGEDRWRSRRRWSRVWGNSKTDVALQLTVHFRTNKPVNISYQLLTCFVPESQFVLLIVSYLLVECCWLVFTCLPGELLIAGHLFESFLDQLLLINVWAKSNNNNNNNKSIVVPSTWLLALIWWDKKLSYRRDSARCGCRSPQPKSII